MGDSRRVAGSALSGLPPHRIGGRLSHRLDDLPPFGDQPLIDPPDVDDHDLRPGTGELSRDGNRLLLAAGFAPRYAERPLDDDALSAARDAVERVLRAHEPYPAPAFDRRWNIVMANRAAEPFLADVDTELLRPPVNLVRLGLDPGGFAPLVVNLTDVRAVFRSRITRQLAIAPDAELTALYEELLDPHSEDASSRPVASDVVIPMILRLHGREVRLFSAITTFGTPMDITLDEVAIESYYPADTESAAYFEEPGAIRTGVEGWGGGGNRPRDDRSVLGSVPV
ncbi:hypothetical protein GCM10010372_07530 [Streptomyces tauricus]|nr:hypothetical protein GCM10010372_07530 [Streptomyces tauricus]